MKKILLTLAAVLVIAAVAVFGFYEFGNPSTQPEPENVEQLYSVGELLPTAEIDMDSTLFGTDYTINFGDTADTKTIHMTFDSVGIRFSTENVSEFEVQLPDSTVLPLYSEIIDSNFVLTLPYDKIPDSTEFQIVSDGRVFPVLLKEPADSIQ